MEIIYGVLQGSILGLLLFNIFLADMCLIINDIDIANYADDNSSCIAADNTDGFIQSLKETSIASFLRFANNLLKIYHDTCHLVINSSENVTCRYEIKNSKCENLRGVKLD